MKFNKAKTMSRRKNRKAHFTADDSERRIRMASTLSAGLRKEHGFRAFPIAVKDKVEVMSGMFRGKTGTVIDVNAKEYKVYVDSCEESDSSGKSVKRGIHASNLRITELSLEDGRRKLIEVKVNNKKLQMEKKNLPVDA